MSFPFSLGVNTSWELLGRGWPRSGAEFAVPSSPTLRPPLYLLQIALWVWSHLSHAQSFLHEATGPPFLQTFLPGRGEWYSPCLQRLKSPSPALSSPCCEGWTLRAQTRLLHQPHLGRRTTGLPVVLRPQGPGNPTTSATGTPASPPPGDDPGRRSLCSLEVPAERGALSSDLDDTPSRWFFFHFCVPFLCSQSGFYRVPPK